MNALQILTDPNSTHAEKRHAREALVGPVNVRELPTDDLKTLRAILRRARGMEALAEFSSMTACARCAKYNDDDLKELSDAIAETQAETQPPTAAT